MKCKCTHSPATQCKSCGCINNPDGPGHRANGDTCGNDVTPGTHRCHMHGGTAPAALLKAQTSMALLRMPAIEALYNVIDAMNRVVEQFQQNTCPTCGYPKGDNDEIQAVAKAASVMARTAQTVLDRTGIVARSTLEVRQSDGDLDLKLLTDDERSRMMVAAVEYRKVKEEIRQRLMGVGTSPAPTQVM